MATVMASMNVTGVLSLNGVYSNVSRVHLGCSRARLGGLKLNVANLSLRSERRRSAVVVRAEEGVSDQVQNASGGAANKVQDAVADVGAAASDAVSGVSEGAANLVDGTADGVASAGGEAQKTLEDAGDSLKGSVGKGGRKSFKEGIEGAEKMAEGVLKRMEDAEKKVEGYGKRMGQALKGKMSGGTKDVQGGK